MFNVSAFHPDRSNHADQFDKSEHSDQTDQPDKSGDTPAVVDGYDLSFFFPRHGSRENNHCFGGLLRVPERARKFVIITVRSGSEAASLSPCALKFAVPLVLLRSLASYLCMATAVVGWCLIWVAERRGVLVGKGVSPPCLHYPPLCPPPQSTLIHGHPNIEQVGHQQSLFHVP